MDKYEPTNSDAWNALRNAVTSREIPPGVTSERVGQALELLGLVEPREPGYLSDSEVRSVIAIVNGALGNAAVRLVT